MKEEYVLMLMQDFFRGMAEIVVVGVLALKKPLI